MARITGHSAGRMMLRQLLVFALGTALAACGESDRKPARRAAKARSRAKGVAQKTEHAFRKAGGHLEKFFTGHDTISR